MITGHISAREAVISLRVEGTNELRRDTEAVIDTGFDRALTLPPDLISTLQLPLEGSRRVILADGSVQLTRVYSAEVQWNGQSRTILVLEADTAPLIGMELLDGYALRIDCVENGPVEIEKLPT